MFDYFLNSADALHLSAIKEAGEIAKHIEGTVIMVTSDKRLLKVSENEGFKTVNPERISWGLTLNIEYARIKQIDI